MLERIITVIQQRYIGVRIRTDTATKHSTSELILKPIREKGVRGLPEAWRLADDWFGGEFDGPTRAFVSSTTLFCAALEFILIAIGTGKWAYKDNGRWKPLDRLLASRFHCRVW